eukprot:6193115-Pleurochrysis_carterae.AAC.2
MSPVSAVGARKQRDLFSSESYSIILLATTLGAPCTRGFGCFELHIDVCCTVAVRQCDRFHDSLRYRPCSSGAGSVRAIPALEKPIDGAIPQQPLHRLAWPCACTQPRSSLSILLCVAAWRAVRITSGWRGQSQ